MKGRYADPKKMIVNDHASVIYSYDYSGYDRYRYHYKRILIYESIINKIAINEIDIVHAHFLFSAGGVAYELKKNNNIDYFVAVRNTDINVFFKYGLHLRKYALDIIDKAKYLIFITPSYKEKLIELYIPAHMKRAVYQKSIIVPNGIDNFWFKNIKNWGSVLGDIIRFIYVGEFAKNKNIISVIRSVVLLRSKGYNVYLKIIGDGSQKEEINKKVKPYREFITVIDYIKTKEDLLLEYRSSDIFVMPSFHETFGLVYIEALSQRLPIIYSKYQGVDGYFKEGEVGFGCNPNDVNSIADCAEKIINNYSVISNNCVKSLNQFKWRNICSTYENMYSSIM